MWGAGVETLKITTNKREELIPITRQLNALVKEKGWQQGALLLFSPHTTAGLTINENADPDVQRDMCTFMGQLVPESNCFHHAVGNSDAHIKTTLFGPHSLIIVQDSKLQLGTWQGVYFCEWDGPRNRSLWVQFLPA